MACAVVWPVTADLRNGCFEKGPTHMSITRRSLLAASPLLFVPGRFVRGNEAASDAEFPEFTERSEKAIRKGTNWLLKTFNRDGGCGEDIGTASDISCSAAVALAFLSQGNSPISGPQNQLIRKTTNYLLEMVANERFSINLNSQVRADLCAYADHHFAAMGLSQIMGQGRDDDESIEIALKKLIKTIGRGQSAQGHWGDGRYPQLAAVTGWCSLRGAFFAGMNVEANAETTAKYLIAAMRGGRGQGNFFAMASGIRVLYAMQMENQDVARWAFDEALKSSTKYFPRFNQLGGEQYLAFHYINETMLKRGGQMWQQWFPTVRDKLIDVQNADGSWIGHSCIVSRTFCTACALLVLSSPNRYLPISQA